MTVAATLPFLGERGPFAGRDGQLDAPFWATPPAVVGRMLDLAGAGPGDLLVDLGCGDGRILVAAALRGARCVGSDIDPARIDQAAAAARQAGVADRIDLVREDLFETPLNDATIVTLYLLPHVNRLLVPKLRRELRPGARVVGHAFPLPGWRPIAQAELHRRPIYLWRR